MPRYIDLTLPLEPGMRGVSCAGARTLEADGWNATNWQLYSHAGTHMDAPLHFGVSDATIDQTPLEACIGRAWWVSIEDCQPRQSLKVADLGVQADRLAAGDSLLLRTGWSRHYRQTELYRDQMPRISAALAHWCVARGLKLLGVETPSVADVNDLPELTEVHEILLRGGVTIVEGLADLDRLEANPFEFVALPLKLAGSDGSPVRAMAVVPDTP